MAEDKLKFKSLEDIEWPTPEERLERMKPVKKLGGKAYVVVSDMDMIVELASLQAYRNLMSQKKKGVAITNDLIDQVYNEKYKMYAGNSDCKFPKCINRHLCMGKTIKELERNYVAAFNKVRISETRYR